eukprot:3713970-Rhodomonas_salina.1
MQKVFRGYRERKKGRLVERKREVEEARREEEEAAAVAIGKGARGLLGRKKAKQAREHKR